MKHYNPTIAQDSSRILNLKGESIMDVNDTLQPCINIGRIADIVKSTTCTNATSATIFAGFTDKDLYITSAFLSVIRDVTSTSTSSSLRVTIEGLSCRLIDLPGISLTIQNESMSISFPTPIKVDRGTSITINNGTAVANIIVTGGFTGYVEETYN